MLLYLSLNNESFLRNKYNNIRNMKKSLIILILVMVWLGSNGQTGPVFQYNHPSKKELQDLAMSENVKGYRYRSYLIDKINLGLSDTNLRLSDSNLEFIFNNLFLEEIYLEEGGYLNSGYDPVNSKMNPSVGHKWKGFVWVFRVGTFSIPLIKEDCGNILVAPVMRKKINMPPPSSPNNPPPTIPANNFTGGVEGEVLVSSDQSERTPFVAPKTIKEMVTTPIESTYQQPFVPPVTTDKKNKKWLWAVVPITSAGIATATYFILNKKDPSDPAGGPAGAPMHRDER